MRFGVLGDLHGEFDALDAVMRRHPEVAFWLSVGDVAGADLRYPRPPAPLYWIQGNNEDFDFIARGGEGVNLHFLPNGTRTLIGDPAVAIAALGGTFAPTWYDTPAADLPYPAGKAEALPYRTDDGKSSSVGQGFSLAKVRDDKRRHFVKEQVDALKAGGHADVLLTHEAPRPFFVQAGPRRIDAGKTPVNELLAALEPRLHFFGHHHRFSDAVRGGVRSIGLDLVTRSWVLVDASTFEITKIDYH